MNDGLTGEEKFDTLDTMLESQKETLTERKQKNANKIV